MRAAKLLLPNTREISCPTRYFEDASEISFRRSIVYGFGVLWTSVQYRLWRWGLLRPRIFSTRADMRLQGSSVSS